MTGTSPSSSKYYPLVIGVYIILTKGFFDLLFSFSLLVNFLFCFFLQSFIEIDLISIIESGSAASKYSSLLKSVETQSLCAKRKCFIRPLLSLASPTLPHILHLTFSDILLLFKRIGFFVNIAQQFAIICPV